MQHPRSEGSAQNGSLQQTGAPARLRRQAQPGTGTPAGELRRSALGRTMSSDQSKQRIFSAAGGFLLALAALALLWAAGIMRIVITEHDRARVSDEQLTVSDLNAEDGAVRSLTFRRAWFDIELRVRYGDESFVVKKPGWARDLLAEAMRSSGKKYTPEQLSGSFLILQTGKPVQTLYWKMYLELETPDGRRPQQGAAALSYSDLEFADGRLEKATPAAGERKVGLLGFSPFDLAKKAIAVDLICHPIDVNAVRAEDSPEKKG